MKTSIQGGSLLSSIVKLLFGGVDKILDSEAEYEEEMGVMKQITTIPLSNKDGKQYTLTIKLSPVRDKEGVFYVEAKTDCPGFDVSSIDKKAFNLTNKTLAKFNDMVEKLIADNKLEKSESKQKFSDTEAAEIVEEVSKKFKPMRVNIPRGDNQEPGIMSTKIELNDDKQTCSVTITIDTVEHSASNLSDGPLQIDIDSADIMIEKIKTARDEFMRKNEITKSEQGIRSSDSVAASLKKVTGSNELTLTAINASCDIKSALDMLTEIADDEEFISSFADDEERSIEITDLGDAYDVTEIDDVDITPTYGVLFREISNLHSKFITVQWAIGEIEWGKLMPICSAQWSLCNLLDSAASWVVRHENKYPSPQNPYSDYADLSQCTDESGKLSLECIQNMLLEDLDMLVLLLDNYYVNLACDEQSTVADALKEFKKILTYAR